MTNKKFKVAAMSMALTACVAAQPLIANAADDVNAVSNEPAPQSEGESTASAPVAAASVSSDPVTNQQSEGAVDVIGDPDISVDYNHDNDKVTKDDSSTTTESTGPVNRDVPKESEPGAQQPSGDGQQPSGDGQQTEGNGQQTEGNGQQTEGNGQQTEGNGQQTEGDLNNEQEGPKDGDNETEKKPIGEAEKTETETKDTELVLGKPNTTTTTTTNPDGSTTTTTTTTTDAALETTTKVEGEASAKTEEDSSEDVKKNLKEELQGGELSWDTETKTKFGDYTVTDAVVKDGKKEFTLTKEDKIETGEMTGLDISKLIEAGYTDNGDGTYTLTKEYTDSQGQKQTTTVKVDSSTATKTTKTTLTVTMASQKQEKTEDLGTKEDKNYPYTNVTVKDNKGKEHTFNVKDILDNAHDKGDGTLIYEDKENNLTYTITKNETDTNLDNLTDTELRDLLNQNTTGNRYSVDADGNLCYTTDRGEVCRVTNEQNTLLRSMLKLGITITDHHGKESDTQKVENSDKTPEQAKADAKKAAQDEALKDALAQAINKETGKNLTKADIDLSKAKDGKFEWTDPDSTTRKTYTFSYTEKGTVSSSEKIKDPSTVDPDASSAEKNTETGSAEVTGSTVIWTDKDQTIVQNDTKTDTTFGAGFDFKHIPDGFELDGDAVYNNDGTLQSFKTKDGKTYEFTYAPGSAPEDLKDISNPNFTTVTWKMTEKKVDSITSPDTSEPTHIEIERNFQKTEDNGTFTFTETKEGGKTYSGLKKVAGEGNVYRSEDGSVTITVSTSTLSTDEIKVALESKGYTDVKVNSDGTASYKDGNVTYNVTYNTTVESITVTTKETVEDSRFTISVSDSKQQEAEDALKAKIAELQRSLKEGEYIKVNGHHVDQHTEVETIISYFKTAINYKNMSDDEIVAMLKKQKADADAEGKSYTGAGVKHNWDGSHSTTGSNPNYIGHLDLATDSDLLLEDGKTTADAILLNEGNKKFKFEWNKSAEDLVNKDKPDKRAMFDDSISYDEGKMNDGSGTGELGHYEYERKYTGSWIAPDSNNYPHESAYYRLTGTIAYNSLEDGKEYGSKREAEQALAKWRAEHPDAEDYRPNVVALSKKDKWDREIIVYKAYTYESSLTAYGYMSKDSNTCVNIGYGKDEYGRPKWAGGFDLRISGLTQVTKTESSAHGKNYYDYYADITKYKTVEQTSGPLANRLLDVIPGT